MEKGRFGIRMSFYTTLAFILAYLGYSTALFLLAGVVIFVEQNEWAGRQVIQAICLCIVQNLVSTLMNILDPIYKVPLLGTVWGIVDSVIGSILSILVLVFCIIGMVKNISGKEAKIVGASKFADWAYGVVTLGK